MKWIVVVLLALALVVGCGSGKVIVRDRVVEVKVPVPVQCPDPGPARPVDLRPVKFVPPATRPVAACLTWSGLKNLLANIAALKTALEVAETKLDGYRRPAKP